jgi:DNA mismatch repair protein MSH2
MMQLYTFSLRLPGIKSGLEQLGDSKFYAGIEEAFVKPISNSMDDLVNFEKMTETTIDIDACKRHEFLINPSYSATLTRLSAEKENLLHDMEGLTEEMNEDLAFDKAEVKLVRGVSHGYHFRVSRKNEKSLRSNKQLTLLETRKDGVKFTSISLKKVSRQYEDLSKQYDEQQDAIAQKALEVVKTYVPVFEGLNEIIARMDVLLAFAHVSAVASPSFTRPLMQKRGSGCIKLQGARHPCVEMMDNVSFIANDAELVRGESNVQVITGPNMGGKSTYIRQTGVVVLLAQIGCFVPCDSAEISVVDAILARVGAGDSQMKGVSTFMKEMMEASTILRSSTSDSLVIIDELGRGTSTYDGFGLAWAIAEYIATQIGAFAMFATHFHELTALASAHKNVVNKHVTAHTTDSSITMLYKIHDGPCDRSFGIHVAEIANFPQQVVEMARQKAAELESFGNSVDLADIVQLAKSAGDGGDGRNGEGLMHDKEIAENRKRPLHVKDEASVVAKKAKGDDAESLCAVVLEDFKSIPLDTLSEPELKKTLEEFRRRAKEALSI